MFKLDTETKEAQLGTGLDFTMANAISRPPLGDSWWDTHENLWEELIIPNFITWGGEKYTVTSVAPYAFYENTDVHRITLPETIRSIGSCAFHWTVNLESINIPEGVTSIEASTFELCRNLEHIFLPSGIRYIGHSAFRDCYKLQEINIPATCNSIGNEAFTWCESLSKVIIEDSDNTLDLGYCYDHRLGYTSGQGQYFDRYWRGMFSDCSLDTLYLGRNINYPALGKSPFGAFYCAYYDQNGSPHYSVKGQSFFLEFGNGLTIINGELFYKAMIENPIQLPCSLKVIGERAFEQVNLKQIDITFPETLDSIGDRAFNKGLHFIECLSVNPPKIVNSMYGSSFGSSSDIVVTVPSKCGSSYRTDEKWSKFKMIIDPDDEIVTVNVKKPGSFYSRLVAQGVQLSEVFRLNLKGELNDEDLKVLKTMTSTYDWNLSGLTIEELPNDFFPDIEKVASLKLPNTLKRIRNQEFIGYNSFKDVLTIPASCNSVGDSAFIGVPITKLECLGATNIGYKAFLGCHKLKDIKLAPEVTIQEYAFETQYPGTLPIITIDSLTICSGTLIEPNAFHNSILKNIVFEAGVKKIGDNALGKDFETLNFCGMIDSIGIIESKKLSKINVSNLETWCNLPFDGWGPMKEGARLYIEGQEIDEIVIPTTITVVRDGAFSFCSTLQNVYFHSQIDSIGTNAFYGCSNLKSVTIPPCLKEISDGMFKNCIGLENVKFSAALEKIGPEAFSGCVNLSQIELPTSLCTINNNAFFNCSALEEIVFPISLKEIGYDAFSCCSSLTKVTARWNEPFVIDNKTFEGVSAECHLYIPIMTASKYLNAGWNFPNVKETGILKITANVGGMVSYNESIVRESSGEFQFSPYKTFSVCIIPDDGYTIKKVRINEKNVISLLENSSLLIEDPEEDIFLSVVFADNDIVDGDVNGDGAVDKNDAVALMEHIVKKTPDIFYEYASDLNEDEKIDISDALRIVFKYNNKNK